MSLDSDASDGSRRGVCLSPSPLLQFALGGTPMRTSTGTLIALLVGFLLGVSVTSLPSGRAVAGPQEPAIAGQLPPIFRVGDLVSQWKRDGVPAWLKVLDVRGGWIQVQDEAGNRLWMAADASGPWWGDTQKADGK